MWQVLLPCLFISVAARDKICPIGYTPDPTLDRCYMSLTFYDQFSGTYYLKSYNQAEGECNGYYGGMLASIHSQEENEAVYSYRTCEQLYRYIGLRCKGRDCRWDDGTPLDFSNFRDEPPDDNSNRCYGMDGNWPWGTWIESNCDGIQYVCWICSVKARKISCDGDELEYKGGCLSVHKTPLNQKAAEAACPGGGRLASIHSWDENTYYMKTALNAGIKGTMYIGGHFSNNVFEWTDGSYENSKIWAKRFPDTMFGNCVQMLLAKESGSQGYWTNIDCNSEMPYVCFRDGSDPAPPIPTEPNTKPKADAHCPPIQYFSGSGTIYSPNFPLSIPAQQSCEYVIGTGDGTKATIKFNSYDCQSGTSLTLFDGLDSVVPFLSFTTAPPTLGKAYSATSSAMKIVFTANGTLPPVGVGWEASFYG